MKQYHKFCSAVFLIAICSTVAHGLTFDDCGSKTGKFTRISVSDCDTTKNACILKRHTNASISIDFTLSEDVTKVKTVVHGKILGMDFPFVLKNPDGCVGSGLHCPLEKGATYTYTAILPVLQSYPKVSVLVKWELTDQNNDDIVCVQIPAKIE